MDLAVDLLDQHAGGDRRAGADLALATGRAAPSGQARHRGTVLITGAMGLTVLGLQQSSVWGWSSIATWACIVVGLVLMVGVRALGAAHDRPAAAAEDLPRPRLRHREHRARPDVGRVRAVLLLRQHLCPGLAGGELLQCGDISPVLLPRVRDRRPRSAAGSSTSAARGRPSSVAAPSARWASSCWPEG